VNRRISKEYTSVDVSGANISDELALLEATMTSAQLTEAQTLAREWDEAHPRD
jgi:hypothetical protein